MHLCVAHLPLVYRLNELNKPRVVEMVMSNIILIKFLELKMTLFIKPWFDFPITNWIANIAYFHAASISIWSYGELDSRLHRTGELSSSLNIAWNHVAVSTELFII